MTEAVAFDALLAEFYPVWLRFHPELAQALGEWRYADRFRAVDDDDIGALTSWLESLLVSLEELDFEALDAERQLDLQLVFGAAQLEHQCLLEADWRHRDPFGFLPMRRLHGLTLCPPANLIEILSRLLERLPEHLRHARNQLSAFPELVSRISLAASLEEAEAGLAFLRDISALPQVRRELSDESEFQTLVDQAAAALSGFFDFLRRDLGPVAGGGLGVGPDHYRRWLRQRHFLPEDLEALRGLVEEAEVATAAELEDLARVLTGSPELKTLQAQLQAVSPSAGKTRLEAAHSVCVEQGELAQKLDWVTPSARQLRVAEKSSCLVPGLGELSYLGEARGGGCLLLPPLPEGDTEGGPALFDRCLDAGWLGLHLLETSPGSSEGMARRINPSSGLGLGWRIYVRDLLLQEDVLGPRERDAALLSTNLGHFRRALLDLDLHSTDLSYDAALARIVQIPGIEPERAHFELTRLCREPGEALAGAVGALLMEMARHRLEPELGRRGYHDRLLRHGRVALPLVLRTEFGVDLWREVAAQAGI